MEHVLVSTFFYQAGEKFQQHDCPLLLQLPDELSAEQFIRRSKLTARVRRFKNFKIVADSSPIQRRANRSWRASSAKTVYAK